jgi:adenylate kinase family enzyme
MNDIKVANEVTISYIPIKSNKFKNLILDHFKQYPGMQIQDMVKLIYQNEFAGGHMIKNEKDSMKRLYEEYTAIDKAIVNKGSMVNKDSTVNEDSIVNKGGKDNALFENIGNGLCRLHLAALHSADINLATINRFFYNTANSVDGNLEGFESKLEVLKQCCEEGILPYTLAELEDYLHDYKSQGYPPVSHSSTYRDLYNPAYRVVKEAYKIYFDVFSKIDSLMKVHDTVIVAIDGNSAAGKSTLAGIIKDVYGEDCNIFHMDDFFLTPELRTEERLKEIGGNVDYVRFKEEIVNGIQSRKMFHYRVYDCTKKAITKKVSVIPKKLNIIEGSYSMHPTLIDIYTLKIFMGVSREEQSFRILKRNGPVMQKLFLNKWIPM